MTSGLATEVKDFTIVRPEIRFRIDGDTFEARRDLPAFVLIDFSATAQRIDTEDADARERFTEILKLVLYPEAAERFIERMSSYENPISLVHVQRVLPWLLEQYGLRPTEPSPGSSSGEPNRDGGTNSTVSGAAPTG